MPLARPLLPHALLAGLACSAALFAAEASRAQDRRAETVVTVGPRAITVGELEDRFAAIPPFQLKTLGDDEMAIKKRFVDEVIVPDALLALGAEKAQLDRKLATSYRIDRARSDATLAAVRAQVGPASAISMDDVEKFFDENRSRYDAPERYLLWRILCSTKDEAEEVLAEAKKEPTPAKWTELAREKSVDKGTYLRGGNLGFVAEDGTSNEAGLRVDPAIVKAAERVRDGELVPQPVAEGDAFAVVWRRGTIGASHRTAEQAAPQIRQTLWQQRVEAAQKKLLADLRAKNVKDVNAALLEDVDVSASDGTIASRHKKPSGAPSASPSSSK